MFKSLLHSSAVRRVRLVALALVTAAGVSVAGGAALAAPAHAATTAWWVYSNPTCDYNGFATFYYSEGVPLSCAFAYTGVTEWDARYPTLYMDTNLYEYSATTNTIKLTYTHRYTTTCSPTYFWCGQLTTWLDPATGSAGADYDSVLGLTFSAPQWTPTANVWHVLETKVWRFYGGAWQAGVIDGFVDPSGNVVQVTHN